jgi:hypothetical protein
MSPRVSSCSVLAVASLLVYSGSALAQPMTDMCSQPKMKTEKWHSITAPAGMTLMIPQGYVARGNGAVSNPHYADAQWYWSGEHRFIIVGSGAGPSVLTEGSGMTQTGECQATIAGRRVEISNYTWTHEDQQMSPTGAAGSEYLVVARFYSTGSLRESFIAYRTNIQSDASSMRGVFWTASFDAPNSVASAAPVPQADAGSAPPAQAAVAVAPAPACVPKPDPNLPTLDAVLDTALVQMLVSNAAPPVPHGFEVISLRFNDAGGVAGISVSQSDFPDATQRQLTTLVASNLKQHDAKAPSTFQLRVESQSSGMRYAVLTIGSCAP